MGNKIVASVLAGLILSAPLSAANATEPTATSETSSHHVVGDESRAKLKSNETVAKNVLVSASSVKYNSTDVAAFLLFAQGPIADANPNARAKAKENPVISQISRHDAYQYSSEYIKNAPEFAKTINPKLQSSSPAVVQQGIADFNISFNRYISKATPLASQTRDVASAQGCGWKGCVKQTAYVATSVAAVWQAVGLHTVGAVTIATVAAVILYLPGDSEMSTLERQAETHEVMTALGN